jgi:hypothetical protein
MFLLDEMGRKIIAGKDSGVIETIMGQYKKV